MNVDGIPFENSPTCNGVSFAAPDAPLDIATITINGRYPEMGWAMNEASTEMVYVNEGQGRLLLQDGSSVMLSANQSVIVKPNQWFAWEGTMQIIMACSPSFSPKQYHVKETL